MIWIFSHTYAQRQFPRVKILSSKAKLSEFLRTVATDFRDKTELHRIKLNERSSFEMIVRKTTINWMRTTKSYKKPNNFLWWNGKWFFLLMRRRTMQEDNATTMLKLGDSFSFFLFYSLGCLTENCILFVNAQFSGVEKLCGKQNRFSAPNYQKCCHLNKLCKFKASNQARILSWCTLNNLIFFLFPSLHGKPVLETSLSATRKFSAVFQVLGVKCRINFYTQNNYKGSSLYKTLIITFRDLLKKLLFSLNLTPCNPTHTQREWWKTSSKSMGRKPLSVIK